MDKLLLLSFDIEEFDISEEYGKKIPEELKIKISLIGLKKLLFLLDKLKVKATFFVSASFAKKAPFLIKKISEEHEIASHGFKHSQISEKDLKKSKVILEKIIKKKIYGFRSPRMKKLDREKISESGYLYDSSMNPTYIPGRYNNFFEKKTAYYSGNLFIIPASVTPVIRFPLFWLTFKNLPLFFIKLISKKILKEYGYINIYFHPWEFTGLSSFKLPFYIKKNSGQKMLDKLEKYLIWLKKHGEFVTFSDFKKMFDDRN